MIQEGRSLLLPIHTEITAAGLAEAPWHGVADSSPRDWVLDGKHCRLSLLSL